MGASEGAGAGAAATSAAVGGSARGVITDATAEAWGAPKTLIRYLTRYSWSRDCRHAWPTVIVGRACRRALASPHAVLGLPESERVLFLKGIHPSLGGDTLVLVLFAGQRPQGCGILRTPGDKMYKR